MRHLAVMGRVAGARVVATVALFAAPRPAAAECPFLPPLPKISMAIPTARELFAGVVVAQDDVYSEDFTVRVEEVLRGSATVGETRRLRNVEPNWPWENYPGGAPLASCSILHARPGEGVAIALGARWSGGTLHVGTLTRHQPPTTFNTMAILDGSSAEQHQSGGRQLFSLKRLRELAAIFPPPTDTVGAPAAPTAPARGWAHLELAILIVAGLLGGVGGWHRTRGPRSGRRQ